ncbi:MAG: D-alanine--D-alanine ligase [Phycisphaerales bacterium]|jgi:D-alanine-D-alanine ligase
MSGGVVLVLGGGPDAEHAVSVDSSTAVARAINDSGRYAADLRIFDRLTLDELRMLPGDAVFAVLHGPWGEGGPMQRLLEDDGRPFVGCGSRAARAAIDKLHTKEAALALGIATAPASILHPLDDVPPIDLPLVLKPVHEGSSVGLAICTTMEQWRAGVQAARAALASGATAAFMVEPMTKGRELTVGVVAGEALPVVEIAPAEGVYDYAAKYTRSDTRYVVDPPLPEGVAHTMQRDALKLSEALGCAMLARVDFMLDERRGPMLLEANTMPGFTSHSLLPMAAARTGLAMPALCAKLVDDAIARREASPAKQSVVRS